MVAFSTRKGRNQGLLLVMDAASLHRPSSVLEGLKFKGWARMQPWKLRGQVRQRLSIVVGSLHT